ncbi:MAG: DHA2 family efflux MFS transporter permease subunit [Thermaerobacter sp.]|nr:DHA2 family efflux MFS transporter permease subunit [Thermaerobacter sp.]
MSDEPRTPEEELVAEATAAQAAPIPASSSPGGLGPEVEVSNWVVALLVTVIGGFMAILDTSIVNVAVPTIMSVFGMTTAQVQWIVTVYMLTLGVVVPTSAWLGDRYGYKQLYIASLAVFTIGSILSGIAWSGSSLIGFRVLQAVGGGMIMPVMTSMVFRMVPRNRIGTAMGVLGVAIIMAPALGPTLGGYLVQYVDWRLIFYINVPIGIFGVIAAQRVLPQFKRHPVGPFDTVGFLASASGLFSLLYALSQGATLGWSSETIILLLYASAVLLLFFVWWELRSAHPLLDMRVFKYGEFTWSNLLVIVSTVALFSGIFYIPLFLQNIAGMGAMQTGLILMPAALVSGLMMPISGRLFDRIGPRPLALAGLAILAFSTYLLHNLNTLTPISTIVWWMAIRGVGMGLMMMPVQAAGLAVIPTKDVGQASAVSNIIQRVAGSFGIAYLTAYLTGRMAAHTNDLAAAVSPAHPYVLQLLSEISTRFAGIYGATGARLVAKGLLSGIIAQQSFVSAIDDVFLLTVLILIVGFIPALFLRRHKGTGGPMAGFGGE